MSKVYDIMIKCRTGTQRLIHDGRGTAWKTCFHVITWCREYNLKDADTEVERLKKSGPRSVASVWHQEITP